MRSRPLEADAGTKIRQAILARAAYAATAAAAFPEESSTPALTPSRFIWLSITQAPRSLNEPVGRRNSSFRWEPGRATQGIRGVTVSPKVTVSHSGERGSASR